MIAALVGLTAVLSAALSIVVVDQSRRADRALAEDVRHSGTVFRHVVDRYERSFYEGAIKADKKALTALPRVLVPQRRRARSVHALTALELKSLSVASLSGENARMAREMAADVSIASRQFSAHDRYASRATRGTVGLGLTALAGAVVGLAGVLRSGRAGWIAVATCVAALLGAIGLGVAALV